MDPQFIEEENEGRVDRSSQTLSGRVKLRTLKTWLIIKLRAEGTASQNLSSRKAGTFLLFFASIVPGTQGVLDMLV